MGKQGKQDSKTRMQALVRRTDMTCGVFDIFHGLGDFSDETHKEMATRHAAIMEAVSLVEGLRKELNAAGLTHISLAHHESQIALAVRNLEWALNDAAATEVHSILFDKEKSNGFRRVKAQHPAPQEPVMYIDQLPYRVRGECTYCERTLGGWLGAGRNQWDDDDPDPMSCAHCFGAAYKPKRDAKVIVNEILSSGRCWACDFDIDSVYPDREVNALSVGQRRFCERCMADSCLVPINPSIHVATIEDKHQTLGNVVRAPQQEQQHCQECHYGVRKDIHGDMRLRSIGGTDPHGRVYCTRCWERSQWSRTVSK